MKKTFKSSSFCNISNFHNGFVWNPSKVQWSLFERTAHFLQIYSILIPCFELHSLASSIVTTPLQKIYQILLGKILFGKNHYIKNLVINPIFVSVIQLCSRSNYGQNRTKIWKWLCNAIEFLFLLLLVYF